MQLQRLPQIRNPVSLESLKVPSSQAGEHRNVKCSRVGECVNEALRRNWSGFSCRKCPLQKAGEELGVEQFLTKQDGGESNLPSHK